MSVSPERRKIQKVHAGILARMRGGAHDSVGRRGGREARSEAGARLPQREGTLRGRLRRALKWADRSGIASPVLRDSVQAYQGRPPLAIAVLSNLLLPSAPTGQLQVVDALWGYPAAQRFAAKRFQPSSSLAALPRSGRFHHDNERIFRDRLQLSPHCHHIAGFGLGVLCPIPKARAPYHDVADAGW